jgi:hypothetical protein
VSHQDRQYAIVLAFVAELIACNRLIGNTHIQKGVFALGALLGVPVHLQYEIFPYGPFSKELRKMLDVLVERGVLRRERHEHRARGEREPGHEWRYFVARSDLWGSGGPRQAAAYRRQIRLVAREIVRWDIHTLEAVMATLWLRLHHPGHDASEISSMLRAPGLKPHIPKAFALEAAQRLDALEAMAVREGLVLTGVGTTEPALGDPADEPWLRMLSPSYEADDESPDSDPSKRRHQVGEVVGSPQEIGITLPANDSPPNNDRTVLLCGPTTLASERLACAFAVAGLLPSRAVEEPPHSLDPGTTDAFARAVDSAGGVVYVDGGTEIQMSLFGSTSSPAQEGMAALAKFSDKAIVVTDGARRPPEELAGLECVALDGTATSLRRVLTRIQGLGFYVDWEAPWWDAYGHGVALD